MAAQKAAKEKGESSSAVLGEVGRSALDLAGAFLAMRGVPTGKGEVGEDEDVAMGEPAQEEPKKAESRKPESSRKESTNGAMNEIITIDTTDDEDNVPLTKPSKRRKRAVLSGDSESEKEAPSRVTRKAATKARVQIDTLSDFSDLTDLSSYASSEEEGEVEAGAAVQQDVTIQVKNVVLAIKSSDVLREAQKVFSTMNSGVEITSEPLDIPDIQGTSSEIARARCMMASRLLGKACVTENISLCIDALDGFPGPYIDSFISSLDIKTLQTILSAFPSKTARILHTLAHAPTPTPTDPQPEPLLFEGLTEGTILLDRGKPVGWEAIFVPDEGGGKVYAVMGQEQKERCSFRYSALVQLKKYLQTEER